MEQREVKKMLRQYAAVCAKIQPREKECRIEALLQIEPIPRRRGKLHNFILEQLGYLGRYCLVWQALWAVVFCCLMKHGTVQFPWGDSRHSVLLTISLLPPLFVLLTVEEITKIYQRSMLEIEYAAKYSLKSVVMIRMLALCVMHSVILSACILFLHKGLDSGLGQLLIYGFTPMIAVTDVLLIAMRRCREEVLWSTAFGAYVLTVIVAVVGSTERFGWYEPVYFKVWCIVCVIGVALGIWQFVSLNNRLSYYEQIV